MQENKYRPKDLMKIYVSVHHEIQICKIQYNFNFGKLNFCYLENYDAQLVKKMYFSATLKLASFPSILRNGILFNLMTR